MTHLHPTILIVDDHDDSRDALSELLKLDGYTVEVAHNGRVALAQLRAGLLPCIILMDLIMPDMNGFEFRAAQLADPNFKTIPVVLYSGASRLREYAEHMQVDAYLQKPIDFEQLMPIIRKHCLK